MTAPRAATPRIGCVKYLNAQPLIHAWDGSVVFGHPADLCRMLAAGDLDVALVSSFEYLRNPIYSIVDDVAVASDGEVYSVFLAHTGRIEEIEEIDLDPASATSANLLRCLLTERGLHPRLLESAGTKEPDRRHARLMIGDQAIRFREANERNFRFWDLAGEWRAQTALPFVFALWLVRPEVEEAAAVADRLRALRDTNLARLDQVIAAQSGFHPAFCARYFRECLRFSFADEEKAGLLKFRSICEKHGILPQNATPLQLI